MSTASSTGRQASRVLEAQYSLNHSVQQEEILIPQAAARRCTLAPPSGRETYLCNIKTVSQLKDQKKKKRQTNKRHGMVGRPL